MYISIIDERVVMCRVLVEMMGKSKEHKKAIVKPFMVKNYLSIYINCMIENPAFDSQVILPVRGSHLFVGDRALLSFIWPAQHAPWTFLKCSDIVAPGYCCYYRGCSTSKYEGL